MEFFAIVVFLCLVAGSSVAMVWAIREFNRCGHVSKRGRRNPFSETVPM